nr:MAG TPA: hypothetical protein [Caudoviricetes sp.]
MRGKPLNLAVRLTAALQSSSPGEGSLSRRMAGETRLFRRAQMSAVVLFFRRR